MSVLVDKYIKNIIDLHLIIMEGEDFCSKCGLRQDENIAHDGPTTVCHRCTVEKAHYCCACGMEDLNNTSCICSNCMELVRWREKVRQQQRRQADSDERNLI